MATVSQIAGLNLAAISHLSGIGIATLSGILTVPFLGDIPTGLAAVYDDSGSHTLTFTDNSGGTYDHEIQVSVNGGAFSILTTLGTGVVTYDAAITAGDGDLSHIYRVRGVLGAVKSAWNTATEIFAPIVHDSFDRTSADITGDTPDLVSNGEVYLTTVQDGNLECVDTGAGHATNITSAVGYVSNAIDCNSADVVITVTGFIAYSLPLSTGRMVSAHFRLVDASNRWALEVYHTGIHLLRVVAGTGVGVDFIPAPTGTFDNMEHAITITLSGNTITAQVVNSVGTYNLSGSDASHNTAPLHAPGLRDLFGKTQLLRAFKVVRNG